MTNDSVDAALRRWEAEQHVAITGDPLWRLDCYREALFLIELVRDDEKRVEATTSLRDARDQMLAAVGSIAANIAEGYGRLTTPDRARFISYALGSAREAIVWYQTVRPSIGREAVDDRIIRLARIRRMLLRLLTRLKSNGAREFDPW